MKIRTVALGGLASGILLAAAAARADVAKETVEADVSTRSVAITSSFTGTEILVFGTVENSQQPSSEAGTYDVVVVVEGTPAPAVVRKKANIGGLWINTRKVRYASFPNYYAIASTRPVEEIADTSVRTNLQIGFDHVRMVPAGNITAVLKDDKDFDEFRSAVVRLKRNERLYVTADYGVTFIGRSLFRSTISLPPNVPVGPLTAKIFLFKDGKLLSQYKSQVAMEREGLERFLHDAAVSHSFLYGVSTVLLAAFAGLAAAFAFRRVTH
jgi:uncharacterized protein (TIGR02186 family)